MKDVCPEEKGRYKALLRHRGRRQMVEDIMLDWHFASASCGMCGRLVVLP